MTTAIVLGFLGGLIGGNGVPHFVRGITRERYPCVLGNGPVTNLLAGWAALVIGTACLWFSHLTRHPGAVLASVSTGVLLIGLFHAGPGAFGRRESATNP